MPRRKRSNTEIAAQQVLTSLDKEIAQARRGDRASVTLLLRDVEHMAGLLRNAITDDKNLEKSG
jgi:hypothetical protein